MSTMDQRRERRCGTDTRGDSRRTRRPPLWIIAVTLAGAVVASDTPPDTSTRGPLIAGLIDDHLAASVRFALVEQGIRMSGQTPARLLKPAQSDTQPLPRAPGPSPAAPTESGKPSAVSQRPLVFLASMPRSLNC